MTEPTTAAWEPPPPCNERCDHRLGDHHEKTCRLYFGRRDGTPLVPRCAMPTDPTTTAAGIPYEGTDCTADEAVEAVEAVRATAASESLTIRQFAEHIERAERLTSWPT